MLAFFSPHTYGSFEFQIPIYFFIRSEQRKALDDSPRNLFFILVTGIRVNMESCLRYFPHNSYNTFGLVLLTLFASTGVVVIGITGNFESTATLQCNPDESLASDLSTRKYIDTQCLIKYTQEFYPSLPLHILFVLNFGTVLFLSIIYAYSVKHRVEIFVDLPNATTNGGEEEGQPRMLGMSIAALDPMAHQDSAGSYIVFTRYIIHLIFSRIIMLLAVFAPMLLSSTNFPIHYQCHLPSKTTHSPIANFTQSRSVNFSIVECKYPMGERSESVVLFGVTLDFFVGTLAIIELVYLLCSAWNDDNLPTDRVFCCFYLLRKSKRIKELIGMIRQNIPENMFYLLDDFGGDDLSRRRLEEMYINVIIQEGREMTYNSYIQNVQK